jgi:Cu+-exporting ATPase
MKKLIAAFVILLAIIACNETKKEEVKKDIKKENVAAVYKSIEVDIEGMTCEIGCARTIESKLSKMEGVTFSKVSFEDKKGQFTYNASVISKEDIQQKIDGIAGGDLYKVTATKELQEVIENKK